MSGILQKGQTGSIPDVCTVNKHIGKLTIRNE